MDEDGVYHDDGVEDEEELVEEEEDQEEEDDVAEQEVKEKDEEEEGVEEKLEEDDEEDEHKEEEVDVRITPKFIRKYEYARLLGARAKMISNGMAVHPFVLELARDRNIHHNPLLLAELEINTRYDGNGNLIPFPLSIIRTRPDKQKEVWKVRDLLTPLELEINVKPL